MAVIDATDLILGRVAAYAARQALRGEKVIVVNCEKAVVTGSRSHLLAHYHHKVARGVPRSGPFFPRTPDRIMRRTIRGMLPYKKGRGREAFARVTCVIGFHQGIEEKPTGIPHASVSKLSSLKYLRLGVIAKHIGSKV